MNRQEVGQTICVAFDELESFAADVLTCYDVPPDDAKVVGKILVEADRKGIESHGIGRLQTIYLNRIEKKTVNPITNISLLTDRAATAVCDANNGMGMVVAEWAMNYAIEKAKQFGIGIVAVVNSNHYGIAGYYVEQAARNGMIGITATNTRPSTAPTYGIENMLGTNPLAWGFPSDEDHPYVLDFATSVVPRGKIEMYERHGWPLPQGWVIGGDGKAVTDTQTALKGLSNSYAALLPLGGIGTESGGHKGYGLATVVEMLCSCLQNGPFMKALDGDNNTQPVHFGHSFIAINPEFFMGLGNCRKTVGSICRTLRSSQKAPGCDAIYTAGDIEWNYRISHAESGCPLPVRVQSMLVKLRDRWNLPYHWNFG